jgi:hypothetical protein
MVKDLLEDSRRVFRSSGFFFRLTPNRLILGAGIHNFAPPARGRYREAVLDSKRGGPLSRLVRSLRDDGYDVGNESYKKVPAGVPSDHPRAALMRHTGLHAMWEGKHSPALRSPGFVDFVADHFAAVAPIHRWLRSM